jgi:Peptidase family S41/N-terminal domain of Peptidase_S41 in eukaryotic IRBP
MLRHLYRCALHLHPRGFRQKFGEEMLSIFDHAEGTLATFRLLLDAAASLGRQWLLRPEFWSEISHAGAAQPVSDGVPSFSTLDGFRPRPSAVIDGVVLSITLFCLTCFAIRHSWIHVLNVHIPEVPFERSQWVPTSSGSGDSSRQTASPIEETKPLPADPSVSRPPLSQKEAATARPIEAAHRISKSPKKVTAASEESSARAPVTTFANAATGTEALPAADDAVLDAAERQLVIDGAIKNLKQYYVYPSVARKMAESLRRHLENGDDDGATDSIAFADLLTTQLREVSHDRHILVDYSEAATPQRASWPTPEAIARYQKEMAQTNCTFEKVEILAHNIGYVKLNSFPDLSICQSTAAAAMASLNQSDAIIFDLRDNHGGVPGMVAFMASYLFDHPTHLDDLYNRSGKSTLQSWTLSPVDGNKLADKPAFVLTSAGTFSGAEEFSYDLKMLRRATIVGETTRGGAHMVRRHRIDDHFNIGVPDTMPINPISKSNWEITGVTPDVKVKADDALKTAERLADTMLHKK